MKRLLIFSISFIVLTLLAVYYLYVSLFTPPQVPTKQLHEFEKRIKLEHEQVRDLKVEFRRASVSFYYSIRDDLD